MTAIRRLKENTKNDRSSTLLNTGVKNTGGVSALLTTCDNGRQLLLILVRIRKSSAQEDDHHAEDEQQELVQTVV